MPPRFGAVELIMIYNKLKSIEALLKNNDLAK